MLFTTRFTSIAPLRIFLFVLLSFRSNRRLSRDFAQLHNAITGHITQNTPAHIIQTHICTCRASHKCPFVWLIELCINLRYFVRVFVSLSSSISRVFRVSFRSHYTQTRTVCFRFLVYTITISDVARVAANRRTATARTERLRSTDDDDADVAGSVLSPPIFSSVYFVFMCTIVLYASVCLSFHH